LKDSFSPLESFKMGMSKRHATKGANKNVNIFNVLYRYQIFETLREANIARRVGVNSTKNTYWEGKK